MFEVKESRSLELRYPGIAEMVNRRSNTDPFLVRLMVYKVMVAPEHEVAVIASGQRDLLRVKGSIVDDSLEALFRVANVSPSPHHYYEHSSDWLDFYIPKGEQAPILMLEEAFTLGWESATREKLFREHGISGELYELFLNGEGVLDHDKKPWLHRGLYTGDTIVCVIEDTNVVPFVQMPTFEVYKGPALIGPYMHPDAIGKTPREVMLDKKIMDFLGAGNTDALMCAYGHVNCDTHVIEGPDDAFYVVLLSQGEDLLFSFQVPFPEDCHSEEYASFLEAVLGERYLGDYRNLPDEIYKIIVNGKKVDELEKVNPEDRVQLFVRRTQ